MLKYLLMILFNCGILFAQQYIGVEYLRNHGNLSDKNFSSHHKNGIGLFFEKNTGIRIFGSGLSVKLKADYSLNKESISYKSLNLPNSDIRDETIHCGIFPALNYRFDAAGFLLKPGAG